MVTDELINHARHTADSATVTAQVRPHSFHHLIARVSTFCVRFCHCRHGNGTTCVLVCLPKLALSDIYLALHFHQEVLHRLVLSWSRYSWGLNYLFFPSIFPVHWPCEWLNGVQTGGSDEPSGIVHAQISHRTFYIICNCMLRFPLFQFPSQPLVPSKSSHDPHITERSSCYLPLYPSPPFSVKFVTLSSWYAFVLAPSALSAAAIRIGKLYYILYILPHSFFWL